MISSNYKFMPVKNVEEKTLQELKIEKRSFKFQIQSENRRGKK